MKMKPLVGIEPTPIPYERTVLTIKLQRFKYLQSRGNVLFLFKYLQSRGNVLFLPIRSSRRILDLLEDLGSGILDLVSWILDLGSAGGSWIWSRSI
jgi:hypothetical protein